MLEIELEYIKILDQLDLKESDWKVLNYLKVHKFSYIIFVCVLSFFLHLDTKIYKKMFCVYLQD